MALKQETLKHAKENLHTLSSKTSRLDLIKYFLPKSIQNYETKSTKASHHYV